MDLPFAAWLARQRWYAGKTRTIREVRAQVVTRLAEDLDHVLLAVSYADGGTELYQLFLGWDRPLAEEFRAVATIGELAGRTAVDALFDERAAREVLTYIAEDTRRGPLHFAPEPAAELPLRAPARVVDAEQSNTSVIFDSAAILKVFRRVVPGINPDVELNRVLARSGSPYVARLLGAVEGSFPAADLVGGDGAVPLSLGMVTEYARNAAEGWAMTLASARDLLAEADLHPDEAGGDFAAEAYRLGEAVASVHRDLAGELGERIGAPPIATMLDRVEAATREVPELVAHLPAVRAALVTADEPTPLQRIHGDLHLGQVLRTPEQWLLIDFEGEPGTPAAARRAPDSPLRDVAGMLRSFDYAAYQLLVNQRDDDQLAYRAREWSQRNRTSFCDGYTNVAGADPRQRARLLNAYELDKVVYEAAYEARHRPGWLWIPLESIGRLLAPRQDALS